MRLSRLPLLLAALSLPVGAMVFSPNGADAKGLKSFAVKVGTAKAIQAIRRNSKSNEPEPAADPSVQSAFPVQVNAVAAPVAVEPPKPVGPPNSGIVCLAGCYR